LNPGRFHPLVEIFPEMEKHAFAEFVADIKVNGVREPVTVHKNQIIDGRNRQLACDVLGITCPKRVYEGKESDLLAFVLSKNLHRRQMSASQLAMVAANIANMTHGGDRKSDQAATLPLVSQAEAAKQVGGGVSERSVRDAVKVKTKAEPEIIKAVEQNKLPVSAATKIVEHPAEIQRQAAASIASGAKPADVVRALPPSAKVVELPPSSGKAKPSAPAQAKPTKEQREAMDAAADVWAALTYLEGGWQGDHDGKALLDFAPHFFWPLLDADQQGDVFRIAKALVPWLTAIIAQTAPKKPDAIVAKPKLVKGKGDRAVQ
jgi:ParB-like chromosome segregation protein Spo0J